MERGHFGDVKGLEIFRPYLEEVGAQGALPAPSPSPHPTFSPQVGTDGSQTCHKTKLMGNENHRLHHRQTGRGRVGGRWVSIWGDPPGLRMLNELCGEQKMVIVPPQVQCFGVSQQVTNGHQSGWGGREPHFPPDR